MLDAGRPTRDRRQAPGESAAGSEGTVCVREWLPDQIFLEELQCNGNLHASKIFTQSKSGIDIPSAFSGLCFPYRIGKRCVQDSGDPELSPVVAKSPCAPVHWYHIDR